MVVGFVATASSTCPTVPMLSFGDLAGSCFPLMAGDPFLGHTWGFSCLAMFVVAAHMQHSALLVGMGWGVSCGRVHEQRACLHSRRRRCLASLFYLPQCACSVLAVCLPCIAGCVCLSWIGSKPTQGQAHEHPAVRAVSWHTLEGPCRMRCFNPTAETAVRWCCWTVQHGGCLCCRRTGAS